MLFKELVEIHKIMLEDPCTKDVFREMDGFVVLMSVLSTIQPTHSWAVSDSGDSLVTEVLEATRLVFAILSEALHLHEANVSFFEVSTTPFYLCNIDNTCSSNLWVTRCSLVHCFRCCQIQRLRIKP